MLLTNRAGPAESRADAAGPISTYLDALGLQALRSRCNATRELCIRDGSSGGTINDGSLVAERSRTLQMRNRTGPVRSETSITRSARDRANFLHCSSVAHRTDL